MTEVELRQRFGTVVNAPYQPFDIDAIEDSLRGVKKEIEEESYAERRKQLRKVRNDLQILLKHFL
jgi:hypothetical protein